MSNGDVPWCPICVSYHTPPCRLPPSNLLVSIGDPIPQWEVKSVWYDRNSMEVLSLEQGWEPFYVVDLRNGEYRIFLRRLK